MIQGESGIREAYRSTEVARSYIDSRFREPLGALLHDRQIAVMSAVISELKPKKVLEVASGPARLTTDLAPRLAAGGVIMDASRQMLAEARRRLPGARWLLAQGDAFALPFAGPFDLVYSFRLIRHFDLTNRRRLYEQMARILRPGGMLVFDAVNEIVSAPLRRRNSHGFEHYDALLRPDTIREEVEAAGFGLVSLTGVQYRFSSLQRVQVLVAPRSRRLARGLMAAIEKFGGGEPLEWVVVCRRQ
jgi:SAM-dependent methyltransferase